MAAPDPLIGSQLGGYHIRALLGPNGIGTAYRAELGSRKQTVALTVLPAALTGNREFRARFDREWKIAARVRHPHLLPIIDAGEAHGLLYLATPFVESETLRAVLDREGKLDPSRTLEIATSVGSALDALHAAGVLHRDVRPETIRILTGRGRDSRDHIYLAEFGISRLLTTGSAMEGAPSAVGTLGYLAPEGFGQARAAADERKGSADLYALGCVLFESLTGSPPYSGDDAGSLIKAHLERPIPSAQEINATLPLAVDGVFEKLLAKKPEDRPVSGSELATMLHEALEDEEGSGIAALTPGVAYRTRTRRPAPSAGGQGWAMGLTGGLSAAGAFAARSSRERFLAAAAAVMLVTVIAGAASLVWLEHTGQALIGAAPSVSLVPDGTPPADGSGAWTTAGLASPDPGGPSSDDPGRPHQTAGPGGSGAVAGPGGPGDPGGPGGTTDPGGPNGPGTGSNPPGSGGPGGPGSTSGPGGPSSAPSGAAGASEAPGATGAPTIRDDRYLLAKIPERYARPISNCTIAEGNAFTVALATCSHRMPGIAGPIDVSFLLFPDPDAMERWFAGEIEWIERMAYSLVPCFADGEPVTVWTAPDKYEGGKLACFIDLDGYVHLRWTHEDEWIGGEAKGPAPDRDVAWLVRQWEHRWGDAPAS